MESKDGNGVGDGAGGWEVGVGTRGSGMRACIRDGVGQGQVLGTLGMETRGDMCRGRRHGVTRTVRHSVDGLVGAFAENRVGWGVTLVH